MDNVLLIYIPLYLSWYFMIQMHRKTPQDIFVKGSFDILRPKCLDRFHYNDRLE